MEDEIKEIAAAEGWSDTTLIAVVLQALDVVFYARPEAREDFITEVQNRVHG